MTGACVLPWLMIIVSAATPNVPTARTRRVTCAYCHAKAGKDLSQSVHRQPGLTCVGCHGGDPTTLDRKKAHDPEKGFKKGLKGKAAVELCAKCHADVRLMRSYRIPADQFLEYKTGAHARAVYKGDDSGGATCTDCHRAHDVRRKGDVSSPVYRTRVPHTCARCHSDPKLMGKYGLPWDTFAQYKKSVHGRLLLEDNNLKVPVCHDCHGSHGVTAYRGKQIASVCGSCHLVTRRYFLKGPHFVVFQGRRLGECSGCHGNHVVPFPSMGMFVGREKGSCLSAGCHDKSNPKDRGAKVAHDLHESISTFKRDIQKANDRIKQAERTGYHVASALGLLGEARRVLARLGPITHSASPKLVLEKIRKGRGLIIEALETVNVKMRDARDRRIVATVILALMALVLVFLGLKYRRLMQRVAQSS